MYVLDLKTAKTRDFSSFIAHRNVDLNFILVNVLFREKVSTAKRFCVRNTGSNYDSSNGPTAQRPLPRALNRSRSCRALGDHQDDSNEHAQARPARWAPYSQRECILSQARSRSLKGQAQDRTPENWSSSQGRDHQAYSSTTDQYSEDIATGNGGEWLGKKKPPKRRSLVGLGCWRSVNRMLKTWANKSPATLTRYRRTIPLSSC